MQKLNLIHKEKSDIPYDIFTFPDGEIQIKLEEINRKDTINIICRITNANELFVILQVMDILDRQEVEYNLDILYCMGMRMDRVMDFNRPFTFKIICELLNSHKVTFIYLYEPHSMVYNRFKKFDAFDGIDITKFIKKGYQIVLPDEGARKRFTDFQWEDDFVICSKTRDIQTGKLTGFHIDNPEVIDPNKKLLIYDDLCDGGGTFCGLAEEFRKLYPEISLSLCVTHAVNYNGIKKVCSNFDHVYISNSFTDWEIIEDEFNNLTVFDIVSDY